MGAYIPIPANAAVLAIASALAVGTGGALTVDYVKNRDSRGYRVFDFSGLPPADVVAFPLVRTAAECMARIREVIRPSITEIANFFGVSRQAIYDWQGGAQPSPSNATRLRQLARVADIFAAEGVTPTGQDLRRRTTAGKNLLEIIQMGGDAETPSRMLAETLKREAKQRETVKARLAGRPRPGIEQESVGAPMLNERG